MGGNSAVPFTPPPSFQQWGGSHNTSGSRAAVPLSLPTIFCFSGGGGEQRLGVAPRLSSNRLWISAGGQVASTQWQARSQPLGGELPVAAQDRSASLPTVTPVSWSAKGQDDMLSEQTCEGRGLRSKRLHFYIIFLPTAPFSERPQEIMRTGSPIPLHAGWGRTRRAHTHNYGIGLSFFPCETNVFPLRISVLEVV